MLEISGEVKKVCVEKGNFVIFLLEPIEDEDTVIPNDAFPIYGDKYIKCLGSIEEGIELLEGYKILVKGDFKKRNENYVNSYNKDHTPILELSFRGDIEIINSLDSEGGIISYLMRYIKGMGESNARKILNHFGTENFTMKMDRQDSLKEITSINGIGQKKGESYIEQWKAEKPTRDALIFLSSLGLSLNKCNLIYKEWGDNFRKKLDEDPYLLTQIRGIGFGPADDVARTYLEMSKKDPRRYAAIVEYIVSDITEKAKDSLVGVEQIKAGIKEFITNDKDFDSNDIQEIFDIGIEAAVEKEKVIKINDKCYVLKKYFYYEFSIAEAISNLLKYTPDSKKYEKILEKDTIAFSNKEKGSLNESQLAAKKNILRTGISCLLGGAGTGKTYTVGSIISTLEETKTDYHIVAPTNKAVARVKEVNPKAQVSTIHKLLGIIPGQPPFYNKENPLPFEKIFVDESSMQDNYIAFLLLSAIDTSRTTITFIGDPQQLPPVAVGSFFYDIVNSGILDENISYLTVVERTGDGKYEELKEKGFNIKEVKPGVHNIVANSLRILNCKLPESTGYDCFNYFSYQENKEEKYKDIQNRLISIYDKLKSQNIDYNKEFQVYIPQYKGDIGIISINNIISNHVNKNEKQKVGKFEFKIGDKVMYNNTNKELGLTKGDVGIIKNIYPLTKEISIHFYVQDREILLGEEDMNFVGLGYALTVHKAQGTEVKYGAIILSNAFYALLTNELLYTAYTRCKEKVFLLGEEKAYKTALRTKIKARNTYLYHLLSGTPNEQIFPTQSRTNFMITPSEIKQITEEIEKRGNKENLKILKIKFLRKQEKSYFRYLITDKDIIKEMSLLDNMDIGDELLEKLENNKEVVFLKINKITSKKEYNKERTYKNHLLNENNKVVEISTFDKDIKIF